MVSENARKIHSEAEHAREKERNFSKSLHLLDEAVDLYLSEGDPRGASEALQSKANAYSHLYQQTNDPLYLILAKHSSMAGVEIAESLEDKTALSMAYRGLAKTLEESAEWEQAAEYFSKALAAFDQNPPPENNRPAVRADMKAHLAHAKYMSGDKQNGISMMEEAIAELNAADEDKYNKDVWLSGAHMRAASMLHVDDLEQSSAHMQSAKQIIDTNPELELRAKQWEMLQQKLSQ